MYILTRLLSCWYFISQLPVPAWKLLLPGKSFIDSYVYSATLKPVEMWGVFGNMGASKHTGGHTDVP